MNHLFKKVFDFLSSVKLAVILLVGFAAVLSVATFYESHTSIEQAQRDIYQQWWFDMMLFVLGVNVASAALSRYPWKKKHTGFVITHAGILIILMGSMITRKFGVEGQMMLQEGESIDHIMIQNDVLLTVSVPGLETRQEFDPWFIDHPIPSGKEVEYPVGDTGIRCFIEEYYFNPQMRETIAGGGAEFNPAVKVSLFAPNSAAPFEDWLLANDPTRAVLDLNIASVRFLGQLDEDEFQRALDPEAARKALPPKGEIVLKTPEGETARVSVDELTNEDAAFKLGDSYYTATLIDFIPRAGVENNRLIDKEDGPPNPAVKFELRGPEGVEEHLTFALFPELGSLHGAQTPKTGVNVTYEYPLDGSASGRNQMDLFLSPEGRLHYRATNTAGASSGGSLNEGERVDTTWNGVSLQVDALHTHAVVERIVVDAGEDAPMPHNNPAARVRLEHNGDKASGIITFNSPRAMMVGGERCVVEFGQRRVPVGFTMELIDFRAPRYPGTNNPARFESDVRLIDEKLDLRREQMVYMNNPLIHNGFKVYQASYIEGENGGPDISIFSVAYAPGTPIIYLGSIVMVLGMIILYRSRKLYFPNHYAARGANG